MKTKFERPLEDLLAAYASGSSAAFNELFTRTRNVVYAYLYRRLSDRALADDVFQETYFRVHRYVASFDPTRHALAWILRIAHGCMVDQLNKRRHRHDELAAAEERAAPDARADDIAILRETLLAATKLIDQAEVDLVLERFVNEDSYEDIAAKRSWTVANARQRLSRALKKLKSPAQ